MVAIIKQPTTYKVLITILLIGINNRNSASSIDNRYCHMHNTLKVPVILERSANDDIDPACRISIIYS